MSDLKKIFIGQRVKQWPTHSWNKLLAGELRDRDHKDPPDYTSGSPHSPVIVRLRWDGASGIGPGAVVKLGESLFNPAADEVGISYGLGFAASEFAENEPLSAYAITLGPINAGGELVGYGVIPEAWWAKVNVSDVNHTHAGIGPAGNILQSGTDGLPILWKQSGTGEKWAVVLLTKDQSSSTPPSLRRFELVANKATTDLTATVKWLDFDGEMIGDPEVIADPSQAFSGKVAEYISGESGFQGYALQRADLDPEDPAEPRWDIIAMEGFAESIVATYAGSPDNEWQLTSFSGDQWEWRRPVADAGSITIDDPLSVLSPADGDKIIAELKDPDTSPPTYQLRERDNESTGGKRVRGTVVDPGSGFVAAAAATFQLTSLSNVYGNASLPGSPLTVHQVFDQGYVAGQITEAIYNEASDEWHNLPHPTKVGCHLAVDPFGFVYVTPSTLAGSGLSVSVGTGPGGCDQLAADFDVGCGLEVTTGTISVKNTDLAGSGLGIEGTCGLKVNVGCGLEIDTDVVKVNPVDLAGCGLIEDTSGGGCKLKINRDDLMEADGGLVAGSGDCDMKIDRNVTLKDITNLTLEIVDDTLKITIDYREVEVFGVVGVTGEFTDSVDLHVCGVEEP